MIHNVESPPTDESIDDLLRRRSELLVALEDTNDRLRRLAGAVDPDDPAFTARLTAHFHAAKRAALGESD